MISDKHSQQEERKPVPSTPDKGAEVIKLDKKINDAIKKRLGAFVKEIQNIKSKQRLLETIKKNRAKLKSQKKSNKNKKSNQKKEL